MTTLAEWFSEYEAKHGRGARAKFCRETPIVHATLVKALESKQMEFDVAERLEHATDGACSKWELALPPAWAAEVAALRRENETLKRKLKRAA
jgi:hypothetical protein